MQVCIVNAKTLDSIGHKNYLYFIRERNEYTYTMDKFIRYNCSSISQEAFNFHSIAINNIFILLIKMSFFNACRIPLYQRKRRGYVSLTTTILCFARTDHIGGSTGFTCLWRLPTLRYNMNLRMSPRVPSSYEKKVALKSANTP